EEDCTSDSPSVGTWSVLECGDNILSPELGEECDSNLGTNETFYCRNNCKLVQNQCGDGVVYDDEECDYDSGVNTFKDTTIDPDTNRCVQNGESGTPCTVEHTVCGDNIKTDNEQCEEKGDGSGDILPDNKNDDSYCDDDCKLQPIIDCSVGIRFMFE
ncbi:hypothetical protein SARC_10278, partial [Sphaeroforma arctica JP610]